MLLKLTTLQGIADGTVTTAFRKWKKPTVKSGGTLKTPRGELEIVSVEKWSLARITTGEAQAAGYDTKKALLDELGKREGSVYRVTFGRLSADPRIALRRSVPDEDETAGIIEKLNGMDRRAADGPWIKAYLIWNAVLSTQTRIAWT